ncbi:MAG: fasciclin domain-containing protein, partial [Actinobacteria bacterium]|nr:fasciclin domain-containing protein [Actinomycetota bacterium]
VETLSGEKFTVIADGQTLSIKDGFGVIVNVIDSGVIASNGVIHVVETVFHGGGAVR